MSFFLFALLMWPGAPAEIKNGLQPAGKAMTLTFKEELRIAPGATGDVDHLWTGARAAAQVNDSGQIFILDQGGNRILEFDAEGAFVAEHSRRGEGPGEMNNPANFNILADNSVALIENKGFFPLFSFFDADMKFVDRKMLNDKGLILLSGLFSPSGKHIAGFTMTIDQNAVGTVGGALLTRDLDVVKRFGEDKVELPTPQRMAEPAFWENYMAKWFRLAPDRQCYFAFAPDGKVFQATNASYEITRYTADLKPELTIVKEYKPISVSTEEEAAFADAVHDEVLSSMTADIQTFITEAKVAKAVELADFPPRKPALQGLVPMDDGGLLVISDFSVATRKAVADIFDAEGKYLGQVALPPVSFNVFGSYFGFGPRMFFKKGKVYVMEEDENEEMSLVRYSYKLVVAG